TEAALIEPALAEGAEARVGKKRQPAAVTRRGLRAMVSLKAGLGSHADCSLHVPRPPDGREKSGSGYTRRGGPQRVSGALRRLPVPLRRRAADHRERDHRRILVGGGGLRLPLVLGAH